MSSALTIDPIEPKKNENKEINNNILSFSDFSKNINNESEENENSDNDEKENFTCNKIIYCPFCLSSVKIRFINSNEICVKCEDGKKPITIKEFLEKYIHENNICMKKEEGLNNLYCREHENVGVFNKYEKYCVNCKFDLCQDCIVKTKIRCGGHDSKYLNLGELEDKFLNDYLKINHNNNTEEIKNFCKLIKVLLYTNKEFPNLRALISLKNLYKFLKEGITYKKILNAKIIKKVKDLPKKKNVSIEFSETKVFEIKIEKQNFRNIKFLAKILKKINNDVTLVKLTLSENNLKTIEPLSQIGSKSKIFVNLTHLDLSRNNLGNENINYLVKLHCKNLKYLFLHMNWFTDYNLIKVVNEEFGLSLKLLYIGFNRFKGEIKLAKIYDFPKLKSIGLNYVFNKENYSTFLTNFKMGNLEELYIQNNGIDSTAFLQKMNLPKLKEIYFANNETEIINMDDFKNFPNLERIFLDYSTSKIINLNSAKKLEHFQYIDKNKNKLNINRICDIISNKNSTNFEDLIIEF